MGGSKSHIFSFSGVMSGLLWPKIIAVACFKNPINTMNINTMTAATINKCSLMPVDKINILVKNIPNGGAPVMAKNPVKKSIAVTGITLIAPLTEAILAE